MGDAINAGVRKQGVDMSNHSILVVDDERDLREVYREALEGSGYDVRLAADGQEALDSLHEYTPDLVVTDLSMPRLGGLDMLRRINEMNIDVDVIFLTGYGTVENAVECMREGASDYLLKPFKLHDLFRKVEQVLSERVMRQSRQQVGGLLDVLNLNTALKEQQDLKGFFKAFLQHLHETFHPDAMALYLADENETAFSSNLNPQFVWGDLFRADDHIRRWIQTLGMRLLQKGTPRLLDSEALQRARVAGADVPAGLAGVSAMIVPMIGGGTRTGAVAVARNGGGTAFTLDDLRLLHVFGTHAAPAIENLRACQRIQTLNMEIITSYALAVEAKDIYTRGHSERVSAYAVRLGRRLGLSEKEQEILRTAGMLHDIGKIGIPDSILNKPESLNPEEFESMKRHPVVGRDILAKVSALKDVLPVVYHHHEWYDGRGYPDGLRQNEIPYLARIISVVDGYEALTSDRSYHEARTDSEARSILAKGSGIQWDPAVVKAWFEELDS